MEHQNTIKCKSLVICDEAGLSCIELLPRSEQKPSSISFIGSDGHAYLTITSDESTPGLISIYDKNHNIALTLGGTDKACGLSLFDKDGNLKMALKTLR